MHVLQVNCAFDAGAVPPAALLERYETLGAWSAALLHAGATAATVVQRFSTDAELRQDGVRAVFVHDGTRPFPRPWSRLPRLAAAVAAAAPDVVHVNGLLFPAATRHLRRVLPATTALVVQDHASSGPPRDALRRAWWRAGLRGVDAFLFTAEEQAEPWRAARVIARGARVAAVPEASRAVTPLPRHEARGRSGLRGAPALLWVGHLDANKDPLTVLDGFAAALDALPAAVLTFVFRGDGLRAALESRLRAAPALRERVELRGALPPRGMAALMSAADVFVLGSRREGSGYALLEALACGALPVVTDIPAFRALTGGGRLGAPGVVPPLLWPPGDAAACGAALRRAAQALGGTPRDVLRAAVRAWFEREVSWPAVARRALDVYREVSTARGR